MPKPKKGESHDDYISRCVPAVIHEGTASNPKQAVAICESFWEDRPVSASALHLRLGKVDSAELRTAEYEGVNHLIVPVIALLGDSVVRPMNSDGPMFVPAEELQVAPAGWNGRPIVAGHPESGLGSANTPENLEALSFGKMFNTIYQDGKLRTEAWINLERALELGGEAQDVVDRLQDGEMVEISVGVYSTLEESPGIHDGKPYAYKWHNLTPDHLAMLPANSTGACSIESGCGAPRLNQAQETDMSKKTTMIDKAIASMKSMLGRAERAFGLEDGISDSDLREELWQALEASVPGFDWVREVFPDDGTVIYTTYLEGKTSLWKQSFTKTDETVSLSEDDPTEVKQKTVYEPIAAQDGSDTPATPEETGELTAAASDCPCNQEGGDAPNEGEPMSTKITELVERLIAAEASPFTEDCREKLAGFGEAQLSAMAEKFDPTAPDEPAPAPDPVTPEPEELTEDEWLEKAPATLRQMIEGHKAAEAAEKATLVAAIGRTTDAYTEDDLKAMDLPGLQKLAKAAHVDVDFGGQGFPKITDDGDSNEAPKPYTLALEKQREAN
jgi:hypothetical protein